MMLPNGGYVTCCYMLKWMLCYTMLPVEMEVMLHDVT